LLTERWQTVLDHPILRLELRRVRRKHWWPGRRFFMFYPALLGAALGYGVLLVFSDLFDDPGGIHVAALVTGVPVVCLVTVVTSLLSMALPWIAPALTATTIARERELGTLDLLRATLLTERSIVLGKLGGCLARLWPGVLMLILLAPFQLIWVAGSGSTGLLSLVMIDSGFDIDQAWVWLLLTGVAGWLKPWGDLALHAAVGLFASALCRSSGAAIVVSYSAILVVRVALWLGQMLFSSLWSLQFVDWAQPMPAMVLVVPSLLSLAVAFIEMVGAALLVWAAVWWLKRA